MIARGAHPSAGVRPDAWRREVAFQHAYVFEGTRGATLDSVQAYDVFGDFVLVRHESRRRYPGSPSRDIVVRRSHFERNGRQGVALTHVQGFALEDSYLGEGNLAAVDIELDEDSASYPGCTDECAVGRDIRIERNTFGRVRHSILANGGHGTGRAVGHVRFVGNRMLGEPYNCSPPIWIFTPRESVYWSDYVFENNYLRTYGNAFDLARLTDVVIRQNTIEWRPGGGCGRTSALWVKDSRHVRVVENSVLKAYEGYRMCQMDAVTEETTVMTGNDLR